MAKKLLITVIALEAFQDKFDHKTQYPAGAKLQVEQERAEDLVSRGLAKIKEVAPPKAAVTPPAGDNLETSTKDDEQGTEE